MNYKEVNEEKKEKSDDDKQVSEEDDKDLNQMLIKFIHHELHKYFVLGIKSNRTIATSIKEKKQGEFNC